MSEREDGIFLVFVFLGLLFAGWQLYKRAYPPAREYKYSDGWRWLPVLTGVRQADGSYKTQWENTWVCCAKDDSQGKIKP